MTNFSACVKEAVGFSFVFGSVPGRERRGVMAFVGGFGVELRGMRRSAVCLRAPRSSGRSISRVQMVSVLFSMTKYWEEGGKNVTREDIRVCTMYV